LLPDSSFVTGVAYPVDGGDSVVITGDALWRAFAHYPTDIVAVGAVVDETPVGMAASSFVSMSLDLPLVREWRRVRARPAPHAVRPGRSASLPRTRAIEVSRQGAVRRCGESTREALNFC
jgi:hypothetical protein